MLDTPFRIAGLRVRATIYHDLEDWDPANEADPYWVLENGALVAHSATIGDDVVIGFGTIIGCDVVIGDRVTIGYMSRIDDNVIIGKASEVGSETFIGSDCSIGDACRIDWGCHIGSMNELPAGTHLGQHTFIMHESCDSMYPFDADAREGFIFISYPGFRSHIIARSKP